MKRFLISLFCLSLSQALWSADISFEVGTKSILDLYNELVQHQTLPPQTTKSIDDGIDVWPEFKEQFQKLALNAKNEGFSRQYNRYLLANPDHFIYKFIETGNLRWIAYFQKNCGFGEPLSYDDKINVEATSGFPGKGSALICKDSFPPSTGKQWVERTITIYSILVGLIEGIDKVDRVQMSTEGTENFNRFVRTLKNNIEKAIEISAQENIAYREIKSKAEDDIKRFGVERCLECMKETAERERRSEEEYKKQYEKNKDDYECQLAKLAEQHNSNITRLKEQHDARLAELKKNKDDESEKIKSQAAMLLKDLENRNFLSKEGAAGLVARMKTGQ